MSEIIRIEIEGLIAVIPRGHEVIVYDLVSNGLFFDTDFTIIEDRTDGVFYGKQKTWVAALQGEGSLPPNVTIKNERRGLVERCDLCTRSLGEYGQIDLLLIVRVGEAPMPSLIDGQSTRVRLQARHDRLYLSDAGLEQEWPNGALHTIVWASPFQVVAHRDPPPGYDRPTIDVHVRFTQRLSGRLSTVAMTLAVTPSPGMQALPVLTEYLPRIEGVEVERLLSLGQHYAGVHGLSWPLG